MLGQALQGLVVGSCVGGISEVVGDDAGQVSKVVLHCNAFGECLHHDVFVVEFVEKVGEAVVLVEEEELAVPASFPADTVVYTRVVQKDTASAGDRAGH